MENKEAKTTTRKRQKSESPKKKSWPVRSIDPTTLKILRQIKEKINTGNLGRKIQDFEIIAAGILKLDERDFEILKDSLFSAKDRLELLFEKAKSANSKISYEEFLSQLLIVNERALLKSIESQSA